MIEAELSSSSFQRKCVPSSHRRHGDRVGVVARLRSIAQKNREDWASYFEGRRKVLPQYNFFVARSDRIIIICVSRSYRKAPLLLRIANLYFKGAWGGGSVVVAVAVVAKAQTPYH